MAVRPLKLRATVAYSSVPSKIQSSYLSGKDPEDQIICMSPPSVIILGYLGVVGRQVVFKVSRTHRTAREHRSGKTSN